MPGLAHICRSAAPFPHPHRPPPRPLLPPPAPPPPPPPPRPPLFRAVRRRVVRHHIIMRRPADPLPEFRVPAQLRSVLVEVLAIARLEARDAMLRARVHG